MLSVVKPRKLKSSAPGERQRHGAEQDDERIAEALELRREHEEDQDDREDHRGGERVAFHAELPRFAGVVDGEALWQDLRGLRPRAP